MKRRPFDASALRLTPLPGPTTSGACSYGAVVRECYIVDMECLHCVPPYEIRDVDFAAMPWKRYHNYPTTLRFRCPACRSLLRMRWRGGPFVFGRDGLQEDYERRLKEHFGDRRD